MIAIEVGHLRRIYRAQIGVIKRSVKEVVAVEDISFEVAAGELFGLLGPNGAGKTTTVKMLTTLLIPTNGTATVQGHDVVKETRAVLFLDEPTIGPDPVGARDFRQVIRHLQSEKKNHPADNALHV